MVRNGVENLRFLMQMTHISGERNVDAVVLPLLWRLHLVPLLRAWVLEQLFWTLSQNICIGRVLMI